MTADDFELIRTFGVKDWKADALARLIADIRHFMWDEGFWSIDKCRDMIKTIVADLRDRFQEEHGFVAWDDVSETLFLVRYPEARS